MNFTDLISKKETPLLRDDFEDSMMDKIHQLKSSRGIEKKYIRLIYLFFAIGLILGICLSSIISEQVFFIGDMELIVNPFYLQILFIGIILFAFEKVYRTYLYKKGRIGAVDI